MELTFRVVTIRKHKLDWFLDVAGPEGERQVMIDAGVARVAGVCVLSIMMVKVEDATNEAGVTVLRVTQVLACKSPTFSSVEVDQYLAFFTARSRYLHEFRLGFLEGVTEHLRAHGYRQLVEQFSVGERGTSGVSPLRLVGHKVDRFVRITHELGLKFEMCATLRPVFEIGYVGRDVHEGKLSATEYLALELACPWRDESILLDEIRSIVALSSQVASELQLPHREYDDIRVVDVESLGSEEGIQDHARLFREAKSRAKNVVFVNAPSTSPFCKVVDGRRREAVWIVDGEQFAQWHQDETDLDEFTRYCVAQRETLQARGIDAEVSEAYVRLLAAGMPESVSLGLGLDRFLVHALMFDSMRRMRATDLSGWESAAIRGAER